MDPDGISNDFSWFAIAVVGVLIAKFLTTLPM